MKKVRKILSIVLMCCLVVGILPTFALATEQDYEKIYFQEHIYQLIDTKMTWTDAKAYCENMGGHLVTITSQEEQDFFCENFTKKYGDAMIGLSDADNEGIWEWVTGESYSYSNWHSGEPNNQGNEDYVLINSDGTWNDGHLEQEEWIFVCEWDADVYMDTQVDFNGHTYQLFDGICNTYQEAKEYCNSLGGHLATITSQSENDFLYSYIVSKGVKSAYFGLTDEAEEGRWTWVTGEPVSYTNWHTNEPNNEDSNKDYAMFDQWKYTDGTWNDGDFANKTVNGGRSFICEWDGELDMPSDIDAVSQIKIGDYLVMGSYYSKPILWRCVDIDENGPLMLSDKIICIKAFDAGASKVMNSHNSTERAEYGSNYWGDSNMRSWLNSTASAGNVDWLCGNPPIEENLYSSANYPDEANPYDKEAGFLTNFTQSERNAMKSVTQKSLVAYTEYKDRRYDGGTEGHVWSSDIDSVVQNYDKAYYENVTDKMFLMDVKQVNEVYNNSSILGENYYMGEPTAKCVENSKYKYPGKLSTGKKWYYWLRSPEFDCNRNHYVRYVYIDGHVYAGDAYYDYVGVRPAFYLDMASSSIASGAGKESSPYRISDSEGRTNTYSDVASTAWYYESVKYVSENNLMNGMESGVFAPDSNLTRAMLAQILYNKEGKTNTEVSSEFTDVSAGQWYADAVSWAVEQGIVSGYGNGMFGSNDNITREQLAVMLHRYAGSPEASGSLANFADAEQVSGYAKDALIWATSNGIVNGKGDGNIDPKGLATRAETAQMMRNYFK